MSPRAALLLAAAIVVLAGVGGYLGLVKPVRDEVAAVDVQLLTERDTLASVEASVQAGRAAKAGYRRDYARVVELGKAVPSDDDLQSLLVQLSATARRTGVRFDALERGAGGAAAATGAVAAGTGQTTQAALPPGATVGSAGFPAVGLKLTFSGRYFALTDFLRGLDDYVETGRTVRARGRLLTIDGFTLNMTEEAGSRQLKAVVSATAYLVAPTEGATAGATPTGPATAVGTGAATAVATTPTPTPGSAG